MARQAECPLRHSVRAALLLFVGCAQERTEGSVYGVILEARDESPVEIEDETYPFAYSVSERPTEAFDADAFFDFQVLSDDNDPLAEPCHTDVVYTLVPYGSEALAFSHVGFDRHFRNAVVLLVPRGEPPSVLYALKAVGGSWEIEAESIIE